MLLTLIIYSLIKVHLPINEKLKWLLIVIFTSSATVVLGFIFSRFQIFIDWQKNRHNDLVVLQRQLNRLLVIIDGNNRVLEKFIETPTFESPIVINHGAIEYDISLSKDISNKLLLNKLEELNIDYEKLDRDIQTQKLAYDKTIDLLLCGHGGKMNDEAAKYKNAITTINSAHRKDVETLIRALKFSMAKTEYAISLIDASLQRIYPNMLKYAFWFVTDWIFGVIVSYKGFWTGMRYVQDADLMKDTAKSYIRFKKSQQEVMEESQKEIDVMLSLPLKDAEKR